MYGQNWVVVAFDMSLCDETLFEFAVVNRK